MFWAGWWIMIIIKHNNNDNINNNSETGGCVFSSLKKNNFICKYQRILSGITNHLHDHEEFLSITSVITSRWAVLSSATCTNTHTHTYKHTYTRTHKCRHHTDFESTVNHINPSHIKPILIVILIVVIVIVITRETSEIRWFQYVID